MQPLPTTILKPTYVDMKVPLTTFEAAVRASGLPLSTPSSQLRKMLNVKRLQSAIQKAAIIYEDESYPDWARLEYGVPSAWDGGKRVIEQFQVDRWKKRMLTRDRRPRYKELEEALNG
ncbi:MAG: hypothetical protein WC314_20840 [Vulcanimicrobiota bacterium]